MCKILFQGDSITDCGRSREHDVNLGNGYAQHIASKLSYEQPGKYTFVNRGVGGNRIIDLYSRIKADIINVKPDVMSILIGVNDVWHEINWQNGIDADKFEKIYDMLISEVLQELPNLKIMIMGAYVTKGPATEASWDYFSSEVAKREAVAKKIAEKYNLPFIPLQCKFDEMISKKAEPYWTVEGVHPTDAGHEIIAREWLSAFENLL